MFLAALLSLAACRKDKTENPDPTIPEPSALEYFPLKVGNWWKYDKWLLDTSDLVISFDTASVYIEITQDSIIDGKLWYYASSNEVSFYNRWIRDSANFLLDQYGTIIYAAYNKHTTFDRFEDNTFKMDRIAEPGPYSISVPAGQFKCIRNRNYLFDYDEQIFRFTQGFKDDLSTFYSKNAGMIFKEYAYATPPYKYRILLSSYHIEP